MGITCACQKIESEEEIIGKILNNMVLSEIDTLSAYEEFMKCVNDVQQIDYFKFFNYMKKLTGEHHYKHVQYAFFDNLRKKEINNTKRIGLMIIFMSKGSNSIKISTIIKHFEQFYDKRTEMLEFSIQELINDIIDANTENCIAAFRGILSSEQIRSLGDYWKKSRRRKLMYHILVNFDSVKNKYLTNEYYISKNSAEMDQTGEVEKEKDLPRKSHFSEQNTQIIKEFIELSFSHLKGEYIRGWLYEDFLKDRSYEKICV